jgi:phosphoadenosine phosphosulfate reductase
MTSAVNATIESLRKLSEEHSHVDVAFSGGKDSWCVLDLCLKTFRRVTAFHMYFVPGLECVDREIDKAKKRYGIDVRQYPDWTFIKALREGVYRMPSSALESLPEWTLKDIYTVALVDSGATAIAHGAKKSDSLWRRRQLGTWRGGVWDRLIYPVVEWKKLDVTAYLKANKIPLPPSSGKSATGIDLSTPSLEWLSETYPQDFERLCRLFPFARVVPEHRRLFGAAGA